MLTNYLRSGHQGTPNLEGKKIQLYSFFAVVAAAIDVVAAATYCPFYIVFKYSRV
jgi:hypothetical protein